MTTQELKQQAHKEFDEKCKEVEFLHGVPVDLPNYYREKIKSFLDSIIDKTVQISEERIVGVIKEYPERLLQIMPEGKLPFVVFQGKANEDEKKTIYFQAVKDIISLITNKSDINK